MSKVVKKIEIKNKLGLHARAAALLVQTVNKFSAQVNFSKDGQTDRRAQHHGGAHAGGDRRAARSKSRPTETTRNAPSRRSKS